MLREPGWTGRIAWTFFACFFIYWLYLHGLTAVGLIGPDEPRYAAIGRQMAISGDWVTPRLWGEAWFEKPALLYWMTGAGFRLGLPEDLAPRLPVAMMSAAFLFFYAWRLRREFGTAAAVLAAVMLATCTGWLGFSFVAVTDVPLAVTFSSALLVSLSWVRTGDRRLAFAVGALLGLAVLAKGLVPLALALPLAWFSRRLWRDWWVLGLGIVLVAGPWYSLCTWRNGSVFLADFFGKHHFGRFVSGQLKHGQPAWFYLPVLAGGLFPWTPLGALLFSSRTLAGASRQLLAATVVLGFVLFSASENKLPGYLLPLFPSLAALIAIRVVESRYRAVGLAACVFLLGLVPMALRILPAALESGSIRRTTFPVGMAWWLLPALLLAMASYLFATRGRWVVCAALVAGGMAGGVISLKTGQATALQGISARPVARSIQGRESEVCVESMHRALRYGLNYYTVDPLPECATVPRPLHIEQRPGRRPELRAIPSSSIPSPPSESSR